MMIPNVDDQEEDFRYSQDQGDEFENALNQSYDAMLKDGGVFFGQEQVDQNGCLDLLGSLGGQVDTSQNSFNLLSSSYSFGQEADSQRDDDD